MANIPFLLSHTAIPFFQAIFVFHATLIVLFAFFHSIFTKGPASKLLDQVIQADKEARSSSPTFLRNHSLTRGMEGGMEGFKLRSKLLKTKLTKTEVETLITELNKIKIIGVEDLANLDSHSLLSLNVKPRVRTILWQCAKKHCGTFPIDPFHSFPSNVRHKPRLT